MALIGLTALLMMVAAMSQFAISASRESIGSRDDARAFYLAEAGIAEAMVAVRAGASGGVASQAAPAMLADGVLWVDATPLGGDQVQLVATGMAGRGRAALSVVVADEAQDPLFKSVLNSRETLTLNADVKIDSFDSEVGSYASQAVNFGNGLTYAKDGGDVSSNDDIIFNSRASVFGDATPGPGHTVTMASDAYVSGSTAPAATPFTFPAITVPPLASAGPFSVPPNGNALLPSGTYGFDNFTLNKASTLTIQGPATLVVNDFTGGKDARLAIDATNGPVTIFVEGNYSHISNFEAVPVGSSPMAVAFMVQGPADVVFPAATGIRGAYYVPNANVLFANNCEAWGSFAANRIDMAAAMDFHYDESLAKHWEADGSSGKDPLRLLLWQPVPVAAGLLKDRRDPFQVLNVAKAGLPSPANAWIP